MRMASEEAPYERKTKSSNFQEEAPNSLLKT